MRILLALAVMAGSLHADPFDDLRLRWREVLTGGEADLSMPQIRARLASIESTARGYRDRMDKSAARRALWSDLASATDSGHITSSWKRLRDMALAWATPGQALYGDAGLLADLRSAMDWMEANRYSARVTNKYDNWWDWEIGSAIEAGNVLVLLYEALTPEEIAKHAAAIDRFVSDPRIMITSTVSTGANRVWKCKGAALRAIVARDAGKLKLASDALSPVFAYVVSGDGFYQDGSFIQHTRHPYTGGYGNSLINELADLLYLLAGSEWEVTDPARENVYRWVFEAFQPVIYNGAMMDMVRGREISRSGSPDHAVGHTAAAGLLRVSQFAHPDMAWYIRSMLKEWYLADTSRDWTSGRSLGQIMAIRRLLDDATVERRGQLLGSWVFAGMDRVVHLRPGWGFGIAMHSSRVYNYESINGENLRAWHTGDGMTYLYNSDLTQFSDSFWPTVDPQRLPGTTVIAGSTARQSQAGGSNVAGGATMYGYTAAMMQLRPDGRQLDAKKSWFLFDDEVAALGSDIRSTAPGAAVETIVENRLIRGEPEFTRAQDGAWAHLAAGNIGYYFPAERNWLEERANRTGAWSDINSGGSASPVTRRYQTIWFDHAGGSTYAYALLPGATSEQTAAYAAAPQFRILENSAQAHAVAEDTLGIRAVNFWGNEPHTAAGVSSDRIASVIALETGGVLHLAVADPTQANSGAIRIEVDGAAASLLEGDGAVTVEQLAPTLRVSVRVQNARGRTIKALFARSE
ncbi:MAG: polysaccharide lyase 8 family protein [Bryobacteraceae bacterium]